MIHIKAPNDYERNEFPIIFLAGSIDMGKAVEWQGEVADALKDYDIIILNPRRDDWDSSWEQKIENDKFREQVEWELRGMENADIIVYYFDPDGQAPITLLELGLHANDNKFKVVCCPDGFWRKGNVDIVCDRYNIDTVDDLSSLIDEIKSFLDKNKKEDTPNTSDDFDQMLFILDGDLD